MGEVVGAFKSTSTIAVNRLEARAGRRLLQENFFEHIIVAWMSWRTFGATFGRIRCDGVKILKTPIDRLAIT
jgi:hypothetical protein